MTSTFLFPGGPLPRGWPIIRAEPFEVFVGAGGRKNHRVTETTFSQPLILFYFFFDSDQRASVEIVVTKALAVEKIGGKNHVEKIMWKNHVKNHVEK